VAVTGTNQGAAEISRYEWESPVVTGRVGAETGEEMGLAWCGALACYSTK